MLGKAGGGGRAEIKDKASMALGPDLGNDSQKCEEQKRDPLAEWKNLNQGRGIVGRGDEQEEWWGGPRVAKPLRFKGVSAESGFRFGHVLRARRNKKAYQSGGEGAGVL